MVRTESGDRIAGIAGTGSEEYSSGTYSSGLPFTKRKKRIDRTIRNRWHQYRRRRYYEVLVINTRRIYMLSLNY